MNRKYKIIIAALLLGLLIEGFLIFRPNIKNNPPSPTNLLEAKKQIPSETFIKYDDPAGFAFEYPDNLSIEKNEEDSSYADILLSSKTVSGSLALKITDSKFKTLEDWVKSNKVDLNLAKDVNLGTLKAKEIQVADRLYLGALDQGILFTVEMPLIENDFWKPVYEKLLSGFSFVSPESLSSQNNAYTPDDVIFEGEEAVE